MRIFCTSPWIPHEWIAAHGHEPRGVWSEIELVPAAAPEGMCPFAYAVAGLAAKNPDAAFVFATTCDQMRRAADAVSSRHSTPVFVFNIPATCRSQAARRLYRAELARLGEFLERLGGVRPTEAELWAATAHYGGRRQRLLDAVDRVAAEQVTPALMSYFGEWNLEIPGAHQPARPEAVSVAIVGGPLLPAQWRLFDLVAAVGGQVALNATEPGERCLVPPVADCTEKADLPGVLADHYFENCADVFQRPNLQLYAWLGARIAQRNIRAILLWVYLHCDLWRAEAQTLREQFNLPVLMVEAQDVASNPARVLNRLSALVEAVRPRRPIAVSIPEPKTHGAASAKK